MSFFTLIIFYKLCILKYEWIQNLVWEHFCISIWKNVQIEFQFNINYLFYIFLSIKWDRNLWIKRILTFNFFFKWQLPHVWNIVSVRLLLDYIFLYLGISACQRELIKACNWLYIMCQWVDWHNLEKLNSQKDE